MTGLARPSRSPRRIAGVAASTSPGREVTQADFFLPLVIVGAAGLITLN